jgi:pimeloyl-ACP methyl ester carboxylesterase
MKPWMNRILVAYLLLMLLTACAGGGQPAATRPSGEQERVPTEPTPTPPPSSLFSHIVLTSDDGESLVAALYPPEIHPAPAVLLLHMEDRNMDDWATFASLLQETGYVAVTLDLRGHGQSTGEPNWSVMAEDVQRVWDVMLLQQQVDPQQTIIVGAGVGANLALTAAAAITEVKGVVLLSPGLDYYGVRADEAMTDYGDRPALIVASQDDPDAAEAAQELALLAQADPVLTLYSDAGHGTEILDAQPDLMNLVLAWMENLVTLPE